MLVTIKRSTLEWTAPDGQVKIWGFEGSLPDTHEVIQGKTRSGKIADALDQTLDLTTTVSKAGKTYYIQVPKEDAGSYGNHPVQLNSPSATGVTDAQLDRLEKIIASLEAVAGRLTNPTQLNLPPVNDDDFFKAAELLGGEVIDDL